MQMYRVVRGEMMPGKILLKTKSAKTKEGNKDRKEKENTQELSQVEKTENERLEEKNTRLKQFLNITE